MFKQLKQSFLNWYYKKEIEEARLQRIREEQYEEHIRRVRFSIIAGVCNGTRFKLKEEE
jgi:hypothetical protein